MSTFDPDAIISRIRSLMDDRGMGVTALSKATGISLGSISPIIAGKYRAPDTKTLTKIAEALGTTLAALLGETPAGAGSSLPAPAGGTIQVRHADVRPSPLNPRKVFDADAVAALAANIAERGLLQPLVVRRNPDLTATYELAAGERRWRAIGELIKAGKWPAERVIDVTVKELSDLDMLALGLSENVQRRDMHPLEEGEAFAAYVDGAGGRTKDLAESLGLTQRWAQIRIALARKLSPKAKTMFLSGEINLACARALCLGSIARQEAYLRNSPNWGHDASHISGEMTEEMMQVKEAAFELADYTGEIGGSEDEDGEEVEFFLDDDEARRLQADALEKMREKAAKKWAWVEIEKCDYFQYWKWQKSDDKALAGALVVWVRGEKPRIVDGLLKPADAKRLQDEQRKASAGDAKGAGKSGANAGDGAAERPEESEPTKAFYMEARRRKTAALRDHLVTVPNRASLAMQLVCAALLGANGAIRIKAEGPDSDDRQQPKGEFLAALERAAEMIGGKVSSSNDAYPLRVADNAYYMKPDSQAALWQRLDKLDAEEIDELFVTLVAARTGSYNGYNPGPGDWPLAGAIAQTAQARHAPPDLDDAYLKLYRKHQLVDLAIASGVALEQERKTMMTSWPVAKLRAEILASTLRDPAYVPPELHFAYPPPLDMATGDDDSDGGGFDEAENEDEDEAEDDE